MSKLNEIIDLDNDLVRLNKKEKKLFKQFKIGNVAIINDLDAQELGTLNNKGLIVRFLPDNENLYTLTSAGTLQKEMMLGKRRMLNGLDSIDSNEHEHIKELSFNSEGIPRRMTDIVDTINELVRRENSRTGNE